MTDTGTMLFFDSILRHAGASVSAETSGHETAKIDGRIDSG